MRGRFFLFCSGFGFFTYFDECKSDESGRNNKSTKNKKNKLDDLNSASMPNITSSIRVQKAILVAN